MWLNYVPVLIGGLLSILALPAKSQEWQSYEPSLKSQVAPLKRLEAESLLSPFCVRFAEKEGIGLTCKTRLLGPTFADIVDQHFHPHDVIFGHFLSSDDEAAVVSGWSAETHPYHWGGTLLLTRNQGTWKAAWYKSGVITKLCEKARLPDGRELLLCELEDGGMGHRYHSLYAVDLTHPSAELPLAEADSVESDFCSGQRQVMDSVKWGVDRNSFAVVVRTPEWYLIPSGACGPRPPKRPPASVRREFDLTEAGLRPRASH